MLHTLSLQLSGSSEKRRPEVTGGIHQEGSCANSHHHPGEWHNRLTQDDGHPEAPIMRFLSLARHMFPETVEKQGGLGENWE